MNKLARYSGRTLAAVGSALALSQAHAAIDITAATTGMSDATTACLAVLAGLTTLAISVWGVRKVMKFFGH